MKGQTNAWLKDLVSGEKVSIILTTNQSSHTDLMGAVITVSYAGNLTEYTWEGSAIQTVIPPMTDYTVSYSNVNGYSTPEPFSGKAMDGRVSEVIGTYNTEVVTVNVSAEEGEVSGYEVTLAKVNKYGDNNEYTQVEYIESNAKQYIDTGFIPDSNTRVVMDAEVPDSSSAVYVFGVSDWTSGARFQIRVTSSSTTYTSDYGSSGINTQVTAAGRLIFDKNKNVCTIGGVVTEHTVETFTCASSLKLLAGVTTSGSHLASPTGKIYSCQIYDNDILVRDYIPVIDSNGVAGLWDKVNNIFYSSSSSTAFIAGNVDGDVIATQTTSSSNYKFPFGVQYVVKANEVTGYITPATKTFTASKPVRELEVVYNIDLKGVWIQDVNGKLWAVDDWDNSVAYNGVAIITDKHSFVLAPKYITGKLSSFGAYTNVAGVTTTTDIAIAQNDFNGYENTQIWIEAGSTSAGKAAQYIFPNGQNGYLPSAGEAQMVLDNLSEVMKAATITAGYNVTYIEFVTSTQYDSDEVWYLAYNYQSDGTYIQELTHYEKTVSMTVWAAAKLK